MPFHLTATAALAASGDASGLNIGALFSVLLLGYLLYRQLQIRPVPRAPKLRSAGIMAVVGVFNAFQFFGGGKHHLDGLSWTVLVASFLIGAGLGVARAYTVKLWFVDKRLMRQGTWLTITLWIVGVILHALAGVLIGISSGVHGIESATGVLYLAMSFTVQQVVVVQRGQQRRAQARARRDAREAAARLTTPSATTPSPSPEAQADAVSPDSLSTD
jgi:hypothetical protein